MKALRTLTWPIALPFALLALAFGVLIMAAVWIIATTNEINRWVWRR